MAGHALCHHYGIYSALVAVLLGNGFLLLVAMLFSTMSFEAQKTTTDNARIYLGNFGTQCFACALVGVKSCWIAIQIGLIVLSLNGLMGVMIPFPILHVLIGMLMICVTMNGIGALSRWTSISLPLLVTTLVGALYLSREDQGYSHRSEVFTFQGVSLAMAATITAVVDMPTYFRHARTKKDGLIAAFLFIGVAVPLIECVGIYLCHKHPGLTVLDTLKHEENPIWNAWVMIFLVIAGLSTNNHNLYSASAGLGTILENISEKKRIFMVGMSGMCLSLFNILESFSIVIQSVGIVIVSMGMVIVLQYLLHKRNSHKVNLMTCGCGYVVGFLSLNHMVGLTEAPLMDTSLTVLIITGVHTIVREVKYEFSSFDYC